MKAPFPWFGGKSRAAHLVWERFGNVPNYVEPFAGSLAVLLSRPGTGAFQMTCNQYITSALISLVVKQSCVIDIDEKNNRNVQSFAHMVAKRNGFKVKTKKLQGEGILVTRTQ
jgi:site-specific DNA-adenine methylase